MQLCGHHKALVLHCDKLALYRPQANAGDIGVLDRETDLPPGDTLWDLDGRGRLSLSQGCVTSWRCGAWLPWVCCALCLLGAWVCFGEGLEAAGEFYFEQEACPHLPSMLICHNNNFITN